MKYLTEQLIRELFPRAQVRKYSRGQIICYQGDKPQYVFFVLKGHIRYYDIDGNGNEKVLHIIGPDNIFPMLYAFEVSTDIGAFYATLDAVEVITIPLVDFQEAINTNIKFSNSLTRWFLTEIEQLVFRINSFEKTDSRLKILHALQYLSTNYGNASRGWKGVNFPITQQFLADFTGLTRETVSTTLGELEKEKLIRYGNRRSIEISSKA